VNESKLIFDNIEQNFSRIHVSLNFCHLAAVFTLYRHEQNVIMNKVIDLCRSF